VRVRAHKRACTQAQTHRRTDTGTGTRTDKHSARTHCTHAHAHCTQVRTVTMGGGFDMHSMAWDEFTRADFVHAF
jgi:hypothetical protein